MSRQYPSYPPTNPRRQAKSSVPHSSSYYNNPYTERRVDILNNRTPTNQNYVPKRGLSRKRSSTSLHQNEMEELYFSRNRLKAGDGNGSRPPYPTITFKIITPPGNPSLSPERNVNYTQPRDRSPNSYRTAAGGQSYQNPPNYANNLCAPSMPQAADKRHFPPNDRLGTPTSNGPPVNSCAPSMAQQFIPNDKIGTLTPNDPSVIPQTQCETCCRNHERINAIYKTPDQPKLDEECDDPRKGAGALIAELPPNFPANAPLESGIFDNPHSNQGRNSYPPTTSMGQPLSDESQEDVCIRPPRKSGPRSSSTGPKLGNELALFNPAAQENRLMRLQQSQDLSAGTRLLRETLSKIKTPDDIEEACELIRRGVNAKVGGGGGAGCCGGGKKTPATEASSEKPKVCKAKSNLSDVLGVTMKGMDNIVQTLKKASGTSEIINLPENADESNKILAKQLLGSQENIDELKRELQNLLREMQKLLSNYV